MNIVLAILQLLLAAHTLMGAYWKISHSEKTVPSLARIPHTFWLGMAGFEVLCGAALIVATVHAPLAILAPVGAVGVAAEMLFMCAVHFRSGNKKYNPTIYWLVVAAICAFIAGARFI